MRRQQSDVARVRHASAASVHEAIAPRWEQVQREREQLVTLISETRVAEEEERSTARDKARLARDLEEIAAARAERTELMRELDSYGELHAEFQRLEVLAREEGRRQALIETGEAAGGRDRTSCVSGGRRWRARPSSTSR